MPPTTSQPRHRQEVFRVDDRSAVVPVRYPASTTLQLAAWMGVWALIEGFLLLMLLRPPEAGARTIPPALMPSLLILMTLAGIFVGYQLLWVLTGRERLRFDDRSFRFRRELLGAGRWHRVPVESIRKVEVEAFDDTRIYPSWGRRFVGKERCQVVLKTKAQDIPLGRGLDESGAEDLRNFIQHRLSAA